MHRICHIEGLKIEEKGSVVVSHSQRCSILILKRELSGYQGANVGAQAPIVPPPVHVPGRGGNSHY